VDMYLNRFAHIMSQYLQSVEGIAAIFNYMVNILMFILTFSERFLYIFYV
jgi:hypothetical protein